MAKLQILVVDDDRDFAESLADVLELDGHSVEIAFSGEEAIQRFATRTYDLAFFDVRLPGKNGVESFMEIRRRHPEAKAIMMTGYSVPQLLDQALANGAWDILPKPLDLERLQQLLTQLRPCGILIADDDPDFVAAIREMLEMHAYRVYVARDGQEALDSVMANHIDILILDLCMPMMSGLETYMQLQSMGKALPTIIVTAYAREQAKTIDRLQTLSVAGVLNKPFDPRQLLNAIEGLMSAMEGTC